MLGFSRGQLFKGLAAAFGIVSIVSLALDLFHSGAAVEGYNGYGF